jgi:hypothetical protein
MSFAVHNCQSDLPNNSIDTVVRTPDSDYRYSVICPPTLILNLAPLSPTWSPYHDTIMLVSCFVRAPEVRPILKASP